MGRIRFSLFILWGYLRNSLGGFPRALFPLRGYSRRPSRAGATRSHSSQIIGHSPHRERHQPQDQTPATNTAPTENTNEHPQRPGADHEPHQQSHSPGALPPILCGYMGDPRTPAARGAVSVEKTNTEKETRKRVKNYRKSIDIYT